MLEHQKYYVCSLNEEPNEIYFNSETAFAANYNYVDVFNEHGKRIASYKRLPHGQYEQFS